MLRVVYDSLIEAARDLDRAVDDVSAVDTVPAGGLGRAVAPAWLACAQAWSEGIVELTSAQHGLADALRQAAEAYRESDLDAARTIARILR